MKAKGRINNKKNSKVSPNRKTKVPPKLIQIKDNGIISHPNL